ncbi:ATP-binding protein [Bacillus benzoevorans]|uniref:ATP-binding protein n=1 Tax=Bacillus benzoevorans TaxID=1456 RepID=UPI00160D46AC|nr:ATP-binding protein [Bacillus benzoevorans]
MKYFFRNIPLYRKILLFSFFISFVIIAITAFGSYQLQSRQVKEQLSSHALDVASLWSTTIDPVKVESIISTKDENDLDYIQVKQSLSVFTEGNTIYLNSFILDNEVNKDNEIFIAASVQNNKKIGRLSLSNYKASKEFMAGYKKVLLTGKPANSNIYQDSSGTWITAFAPIKKMDGEIIALLGIDISAAAIQALQKKYTMILLLALLIITPCVYIILRKWILKVLEPVNELIYGINEVSNGNFNVNLKVEDHSDLGMLSERFNIMTKQLSVLFEKLSATSEHLSTEPRNLILHNFEEALDEMENIMEKSKLHRELQRAEKMNAIGQLAASVAHEIRNPMTVVKGFLQIFLAKEQMSEEERMYIRLMIDEMNRAETIINDYLSLAKPDLEHTESIPGNELAEKVMDLMNSYAMMSKSITIETPVLERVAVKGNKGELQQVLINILKNGIEAMKDGGKLSLSFYREEDYGVFKVTDTGIGMTQKEIDRLGTAFYSLKEKGTGMGLTVCYQIVERMKGRIEVESDKGEGTTFRIYIPVWEYN